MSYEVKRRGPGRPAGSMPPLPPRLGSTDPLVVALYQKFCANRTTLGALARRSGVDRKAIARWFAGTAAPSAYLLEAVGNALGMTLIWKQGEQECTATR